MKILTVNNKIEEKFLRTKTADFEFGKHDKKDIADLIKNMREIMTKANGIGLSANQIGLNIRLFVAQIPKIHMNTDVNTNRRGYNIGINQLNHHKSTFYAIFNPKIKVSPFSRKKTKMEEGCLSVPQIYGKVERLEKITITGYDKNGRKIKIKAEGLTARVFQHEIDHLNGILFIDKAENLYKIANG